MYIHISNCGDDGISTNESFVEITDQHYTVPVFCMSLQTDILLNVYSYKVVKGLPIKEPFTGFYQNKLILFCNDISKLDLRKIAYNFHLSSLVGQFPKFDYSGNFSQYKINEQTYKINWNLGKKFSHSFPNDDNDIFTITIDGKMSRSEAMTEVLLSIYKPQIMTFLSGVINKMEIGRKVLSFDIGDSPCSKAVLSNGMQIVASSDCCNGLCIPLEREVEYTAFRLDFKNYCKIFYTSHIVYQTLQTMKFLLVHELCHCKIGCQHSHDSLFWYMFEVFTGMEKTVDWAWRKEQCQTDDNEFNRCTNGQLNNYLISYKQRYPMPKHIQHIRNWDSVGAYSGLYDKNKTLTCKKYKTRLIELVLNIEKFLNNYNFLQAAYIVEYFFEWNNMATRFTINYDKEDQIIIDDIVNCSYKIYFSIIYKWENKESVCKTQIKKIKQLIEVLSDPVDIPNPEDILIEAKSKRDYIINQLNNAGKDVGEVSKSSKRVRRG